MKILVVGAGSIGKVHAGNAAALADKVAIFDQDAGRTKAVPGSIEAISTLDKALAWGADGVVVATPHDTHIAVADKFITAGAHVLIEKPLSHNLSGVDDFLARASRVKRGVYVVCNMRYHPAVKLLRQNLALIGKPLFARAWFGNYLPNMRPGADYRELYCAHKNRGGGVILDGIHEIDYLSWLLGEITAVSCEAAKLSDLDIDVEDYAETVLHHAGGARSEIHQDYLQQVKRRGCEIAGSKGTLIWESEGKKPEYCKVRLFHAESQKWQTLLDSVDVDYEAMYRELMQKFIAAVKNGQAPDDLLTGQKAAHDLAAALGALKSAETGERVELTSSGAPYTRASAYKG